MGANYLLGGEELECCSVEEEKNNNIQQTCLCCFREKFKTSALHEQVDISCPVLLARSGKFRTGVGFEQRHQCLQPVEYDAVQTVISFNSVSVRKQQNHWCPLVASPSRVVLKQQGLWWELLYLLLPCVCFHYCTLTATIVNHSIIFTFPVNTDYPPLEKNNNKTTKYLL